MSSTACGGCGGFGCDVRAARGLARFCEIDRTAPSKIALPKTYPTHSAAVAASPTGRARWVGGGTGTGSPKRFAPC
jgi:hypothetical protein